jgi:hypothetical protein
MLLGDVPLLVPVTARKENSRPSSKLVPGKTSPMIWSPA